MDPNTARQVLRISPDIPLTAAIIETAYANETWAWHPSRYPDATGRQRAADWATTLGEARALLFAETHMMTAPSSEAPGPPAQRRHRLSGGAVAGIVAGAVAVVAIITFGVIGLASIATVFSEGVVEASQAGGGDFNPVEQEPATVERYSSAETMYSFPAALEYYNDARYNPDCPAGYIEGCWQAALLTETDCGALRVELGFSNDPDAWTPEYVETLDRANVIADEATPIVFGNDDYDYGWINDVVCLEAAS